jgi:preprotein translocase subunit SecB
MVDVSQPTKSLMQLALVIAPRVQIKDILLANSSIRSKLDSIAPSMRVEYAMEAQSSCDRDAKELVVRATLMTCAKNDSGAKVTEEIFHIEAEFILRYSIDSIDGIDDEHVKAFGRINGIHNAWPYWREYVQSTTVRLGLPPLALPLMTGDSLLAHFSKLSKSDLTVENASTPAKPGKDNTISL